MQDSSESALSKITHSKWLRALFVIDIIIIVVIAIMAIHSSRKTAFLTFRVTPVDATITVNGEGDYENFGDAYSFIPGAYTIQISHDGLDSKTFDVNLEENYNTAIVTFLSGNGNLEYYELRENLESYEILEDIASKENNQTTDHDSSAENFISRVQADRAFMEELPIIDKTPSKYGNYYGTHYQYDTLKIQSGLYLDECRKILCLYITDTSGEKEEYALSVIDKFGVNHEDFQIIYQKEDYE